MTEYGKLKNAELEALLKARNLPHTGKKADMVARLEEDDKKTQTAPGADASAPAAAAEDEIDWDDEADATKPTADPSKDSASNPTDELASAPTEGAVGEIGNGAVASSDAVPQEADSNGAAAEAKPAEVKPPVDFAQGLASTTLEQELEKRRARAKKFGTEFDEEKEKEQLKLLDRAKKFGHEAATPKGLNEALPERRERKRGREQGNDGREDAKRGKKRFDNKKRGDRKPDGRRNQGQTNGSHPNWMNEKDRAAAEARKAKFAS